MHVCALVDGLPLASVVDGGFGGLEDPGGGRAHVQFSQSQLVHEIRQLQEAKAGDVVMETVLNQQSEQLLIGR